MVICEKMTLLHNFTLLFAAAAEGDGSDDGNGLLEGEVPFHKTPNDHEELAQIYGIHGTSNDDDDEDDDDDTRQPSPASGKMRIIVEANETDDDESDLKWCGK